MTKSCAEGAEGAATKRAPSAPQTATAGSFAAGRGSNKQVMRSTPEPTSCTRGWASSRHEEQESCWPQRLRSRSQNVQPTAGESTSRLTLSVCPTHRHEWLAWLHVRHLWCHGTRYVRHAPWYAYGVRAVCRALVQAALRVRYVQQRRRLAPIPHTYSTEEPGRGCQLSSPRSAARGVCCCAAATMSDRRRTCSQSGSSHHPRRPCLRTAAAHAPHTRPRPPPMSQRNCRYKSVGPRCSVTATLYRLKGHCCK